MNIFLVYSSFKRLEKMRTRTTLQTIKVIYRKHNFQLFAQANVKSFKWKNDENVHFCCLLKTWTVVITGAFDFLEWTIIFKNSVEFRKLSSRKEKMCIRDSWCSSLQLQCFFKNYAFRDSWSHHQVDKKQESLTWSTST